MSSIIVLDSSDEDELPTKKPCLQSTSSLEFGNSSTTSNSRSNIRSKQRNLPSGITITPHSSHGTHVTKSQSASAMQISRTSPLLAPNINHAMNNLINNERQTPTPPKVPVLIHRNRKPTSPPTSLHYSSKSFGNMSASNTMSPAAAATTLAPLPPILPMIASVHSMAAAGTTPPLQLLATPPRMLGNITANMSDQTMINPSLLQSNLPITNTITKHPSPNPNKNNINNNFKIHLPPKPLTPSPSASPTSFTMQPTSPHFANSNYKGRQEKPSKRVKLTTILKSTDDAWLQQRPRAIVTSEDMYHSAQHYSKEMAWEGASVSPESSKSSSRQQTPVASPSLPKVRKSPETLQLTTKATEVFDLTSSPGKHLYTSDSLDKQSNRSCEKQLNGESGKRLLAGENGESLSSPKDEQKKPPPKLPLEPEFEELIEVCKKADPSSDMSKLIKTKLVKYYYEVHADFVKSKSFRKSLRKVVSAIRAEPDLVYYNLTTIVEELKIRRKAKVTDVTTITATLDENNTAADIPVEVKEEKVALTDGKTTQLTVAPDPSTSTSAIPMSSTGNKKLDEQIKKLNKALYVLTKRIDVLEQSEVDWDDDDSSFLQVERFKKRACQIYEKICDLTGESKNAHRLVKKPIRFNETRIPQFNKTLQAFINRTKEFPDYYDVLRMLEHCNRSYSLGLVNFEIKNIAEDAFIKVGKLLQSRRKADLYETVTHYGGREKDPAQSDPLLAAKLSENQKNCRRVEDILEKYSRKQDMPEEDDDEDNKADTKVSEKDVICPSIGVSEECNKSKELKAETNDSGETVTVQIANDIIKEESVNKLEDGETDDDEEEDDDEDDADADLEEHVETLANGDETDNESENENSNRDEKERFLSANEPQSQQNHLNENLVIEKDKNDRDVPICKISHIQSLNYTKDDVSVARIATNNNNISIPESKTVLIDTAKTQNTPPPNGKFKESVEVEPFTSNVVTSTPIVNATTTTTTTTADVKIVTVSSHNVEEMLSCNSSPKVFTDSTSKTLEEIVISDEES